MSVYYISKQKDLSRTTYDLDFALNNLINKDWIGCDTETTGLDPYTLHPILLGFVHNHDYFIINALTYSKKELEDFFNALKDKEFIFHNAKFDLKVIKCHYNVLLTNVFCTYVNHQIIYNGCTAITHSYDSVVERIFKIHIDKSVRSTFINRDLNLPITEEEIEYLVKDLEYLKPLYDKIQGGLIKHDLIECSKLENSFTPVLAQLELNGIKIDVEKWKSNTNKYLNTVKDLEIKIKEEIKNLSKLYPKLLSDSFSISATKSKKIVKNQLNIFSVEEVVNTKKVIEDFNISSSSQVLKLLQRCNVFLEDSGEETLNKYVLENPNTHVKTFISLLLDYREFVKLTSTYGNNFLQYVNSVTGFIHADYFQNNTATGRLSCNNPNIQNIPNTKEIRECFIPDNDSYTFVNIDLSGQEVRLAASYSQDSILLDSFNKGLDLHSYLAQGSYRIITGDNNLIVSKSENKSMRNAHKPILFGALYGAGSSRISDVLNIPKSIAEKVYNNLKLSLPELFKYQETVKKLGVKTKTVRCGSYINRVKRFNFLAKSITEDYKIEKESCNFPIQSSGASMLKLCTIKIQDYINTNNLDCQIKASVHDELIIQIPINRQDIADKIKEIMQDTANLFLKGVVMESEMSVAPYWQH